MPKVIIDKEICKGCGLCTKACPQKIIKLSKQVNSKGYPYAAVEEISRCTGCTFCAIICPDSAIVVEKEDKV